MPGTSLSVKEFCMLFFWILIAYVVFGAASAALYKAAPNVVTKGIYTLVSNSYNVTQAAAAK